MGSDTIISVENLGKRYQLGNVVDMQSTFREMLIGMPMRAGRSVKGLFSRSIARVGVGPTAAEIGTPDGTFWALRDVSLEVKEGEVLGVVGGNGAGKSTLLKILSRITTPTTGRARIYGRVGALLEVGTGMHQELSGHENIYLNGAILGMTKAEIDSKYDEIVDFAGVEKFLQTPIKRYSSGMRVRLGFSVAAHLEPEVLVVDEVLSVGDAEFRRKCLGKMENVAREGRTVLFVSHNLSAVRQLCTRCILLSNGQNIMDGDPEEVVRTYLRTSGHLEDSHVRIWTDPDARPGDDVVRVHSAMIQDCDGKPIPDVSASDDFWIEIKYQMLKNADGIYAGFGFMDDVGNRILGSWDFHGDSEKRIAGKTYTSRCRVPGNILSPGVLFVNVSVKTLATGMAHARGFRALKFEILPVLGKAPYSPFGIVNPVLDWVVERENS